MIINKAITTLVFDFGGVLINLDLPVCIQNLKKLGFENVEIFLSNFGQKDFFLQFENGEIGTAEFRNHIRRYTSRAVTDAEIDAAWCSFLCDFPAEKVELLKELRKKYRLLLLSNTNPLHIEVSAQKALAVHNTSLGNLFDTCYLSYQMGITKPHTAIFKTMLHDASLKATECLFLDDGEKNIEAAQQLGFETYLVKPSENLNFLLALH
ncbi:MAG: hypothetical protein AUK44_01515 [Porphyromonadaceae bacterium CG2_30_38_12]|nr:MAG: hypothetical protein AUK44_01515 [Porphyromonadaceae bacterium CG2_30_38_12]